MFKNMKRHKVMKEKNQMKQLINLNMKIINYKFNVKIFKIN